MKRIIFKKYTDRFLLVYDQKHWPGFYLHHKQNNKSTLRYLVVQLDDVQIYQSTQRTKHLNRAKKRYEIFHSMNISFHFI